MPDLPVAVYPGVISTHEEDTVVKNIEDVLVDQIVQGLTAQVKLTPMAKATAQPADRDIVFTGSFEEINEYFQRNNWTDGLPVVPPTIEKVEAFLKFTDRSPDDVLGVLHPSRSQASVWKVAVNGVMAGCRPEYMPILVAIVEVMTAPEFGMRHAGSTPGGKA